MPLPKAVFTVMLPAPVNVTSETLAIEIALTVSVLPATLAPMVALLASVIVPTLSVPVALMAPMPAAPVPVIEIGVFGMLKSPLICIVPPETTTPAVEVPRLAALLMLRMPALTLVTPM